MKAEHFVYFVQSGGAEGPVKIGYTNNVARRLEALQNAHAAPLRLLSATPVANRRGAQGNERFFHRVFATQRMQGEWFVWSQALADFIEIQERVSKTYYKTKTSVHVDFEFTEGGRCVGHVTELA